MDTSLFRMEFLVLFTFCLVLDTLVISILCSSSAGGQLLSMPLLYLMVLFLMWFSLLMDPFEAFWVLGWRKSVWAFGCKPETYLPFWLWARRKKKTKEGERSPTTVEPGLGSYRMLHFSRSWSCMRRLQLLSFLSFTDTQRCFIQKDNGGFLLHFPRVAIWNFFVLVQGGHLSLIVIITYLTRTIVFMSTIFF
jgi:hypothetical protein